VSGATFHYRGCPFYGSTSDQLDGCILQLRQGQAEELTLVRRLEAWTEGLRQVRESVPALDIEPPSEEDREPDPEVYLW
jgi:hypothetical protein